MASLAGQLDEALIETEIVPDGVLPALGLESPVVGELVSDEVVDVAELQLALLTLLDAHRDHGHVAVGRLHVGIYSKNKKIFFDRALLQRN